jgi:predicted N-formylglutamate amidohydrolase
MAVGTGWLLGADEPAPVAVEREGGTSAIVISCDHAGRRIPIHLGRLGLAEPEFDRHIAWDIGALGVARVLSATLDATLVRQRYSRLVVDCNRPPGVPGAIPAISERTDIPGNRGLGESEREARFAEIFRPYHDRLTALLDERDRQGPA